MLELQVETYKRKKKVFKEVEAELCKLANDQLKVVKRLENVFEFVKKNNL
jgi:hypothetical protein